MDKMLLIIADEKVKGHFVVISQYIKIHYIYTHMYICLQVFIHIYVKIFIDVNMHKFQ